jgi:hypothetical protein
VLFEIAERTEAIVEDGSGKGGVGVSFTEDFDEVRSAAGTSGRDDRNVKANGYGAS